MCGKWKHNLLGACHPRKNLEFRTSKIASAGFSGQVSVAKIIHISSIQEAVIAIQLSRKCLMYCEMRIHASLNCVLDSVTCGANLKLRQARAQAKVAQACARVCQGLATPLETVSFFRCCGSETITETQISNTDLVT